MSTIVPPVTEYTGTVPSRGQSQADFNTNTAAFLSYIDTFGPDLNDTVEDLNLAVAEVNADAATASGAAATATAAANAEAYSGSETYNFPDTVIGSDGHAYRCIDTGVSGDDPVGSTTGDWQPITTDTADVINRISARRNLLWNPDMAVNQDNYLFASPASYGPDFWFVPNEESSNSDITHTATYLQLGDGSFDYGVWAQLIDERIFDSSGTIQVGGLFEDDYVTISADVLSGYSMEVRAGYGTASGSNLTTVKVGDLTPTNREVTFQVDYNSATNTYLAIKLVPTGAGSPNIVRFNNLKLNVGQSATPYEQPIKDDQLRQARHWYRRSYAYGVAPGGATSIGALSARNWDSGTARGLIQGWPARGHEMRAIPSVLIYSPNTGNAGKIYDRVGTSDLTVSSVSNISETGFDEIQLSGTLPSGNHAELHYTMDARL